jgi:N6-adenosine-specific RNA methylase IME4
MILKIVTPLKNKFNVRFPRKIEDSEMKTMANYIVLRSKEIDCLSMEIMDLCDEKQMIYISEATEDLFGETEK